jgi:pimeloyl-ACP methyl ester carboxylesterase
MRAVKSVAIALLLIAALLLALAAGWRAVMQGRVKKATAINTAGGVESLEEVTLGGVGQWLLIRGLDRSNPVLLHLHGGPGSADISIARFFDAGLIGHFTVVHWDQRGAGKSFDPDIPPESMIREQFVLDTRDLASMLRSGSASRRSIGHYSWGAIGPRRVALSRAFHAYVGSDRWSRNRAGAHLVSVRLDKAREAGDQ